MGNRIHPDGVSRAVQPDPPQRATVAVLPAPRGGHVYEVAPGVDAEGPHAVQDHGRTTLSPAVRREVGEEPAVRSREDQEAVGAPGGPVGIAEHGGRIPRLRVHPEDPRILVSRPPLDHAHEHGAVGSRGRGGDGQALQDHQSVHGAPVVPDPGDPVGIRPGKPGIDPTVLGPDEALQIGVARESDAAGSRQGHLVEPVPRPREGDPLPGGREGGRPPALRAGNGLEGGLPRALQEDGCVRLLERRRAVGHRTMEADDRIPSAESPLQEEGHAPG